MQWTAGATAGFNDGTDPWLAPVDPDGSRNVDAQLRDPASMLSFYRNVLAARAASAALQIGAYAPLDGLPHDVFAYHRTHDGERMTVYLNFGDGVVEVEADGRPVVGTTVPPVAPNEGRLRLEPRQGVVLSS